MQLRSPTVSVTSKQPSEMQDITDEILQESDQTDEDDEEDVEDISRSGSDSEEESEETEEGDGGILVSTAHTCFLRVTTC